VQMLVYMEVASAVKDRKFGLVANQLGVYFFNSLTSIKELPRKEGRD
jgi:hypothetical protein